MISVPEQALAYGFRTAAGGTASRRSILLPDLVALLAECPPDATSSEYRAAVVDRNVLFKSTIEARKTTFEVLSHRYGLDPGVTIFRALRTLWDEDAKVQPPLALLCALARDSMLRSTADLVLATPIGATVAAPALAEQISVAFPGRFGEKTLELAGRFASASWTQGGSLAGTSPKIRVEPTTRPVALAYALLLGHLCGVRGDALFETLWARVVDVRPHRLRDLAAEASRLGWIDLRRSGGVTEIGFRHVLGDCEAAG